MPKIEGDKVYEKESWRERMKGKKIAAAKNRRMGLLSVVE